MAARAPIKCVDKPTLNILVGTAYRTCHTTFPVADGQTFLLRTDKYSCCGHANTHYYCYNLASSSSNRGSSNNGSFLLINSLEMAPRLPPPHLRKGRVQQGGVERRNRWRGR